MPYESDHYGSNLVISFIVSFSLSLIPEHYKWFDVGIFEIIVFSLVIYPFVMGLSPALADLYEYKNLYFAVDSFKKGFKKPFTLVSDYRQALKDDSEQYRFYSSDIAMRNCIKLLWQNFYPMNITTDQNVNQNLLKTMILLSLDDNDFNAQDKIYNAFGSALYSMKEKSYLLDRITNDALNKIYVKYLTTRMYATWGDIYDLSNEFMNFVELYNFAVQQYEYSRSYSYRRSESGSSYRNSYSGSSSSGSSGNRSSHSSSNGYRSSSSSQSVNRYEEHYRILKVSSSATLSEVKTSYRKLMKENHPDRFVNADEATKKNANETCQKITASYSVLKKVLS